MKLDHNGQKTYPQQNSDFHGYKLFLNLQQTLIFWSITYLRQEMCQQKDLMHVLVVFVSHELFDKM